MLRRNQAKASDTRGMSRPMDEEFQKAYPLLYEMMTETRYEDGTEREVASMTVWADAGAWKACLNDRDAGLVCFVTGVSYRDLMQSLEGGLAQGGLDWRVSNSRPKKK